MHTGAVLRAQTSQGHAKRRSGQVALPVCDERGQGVTIVG